NVSTGPDYIWDVDTTAPSTLLITSGPWGVIYTSVVDFTVSATGASEYRYSLDGGSNYDSWTASTDYGEEDLDDGQYTFTFQARDAAGNISDGPTRDFVVKLFVDTTDPINLNITSLLPNNPDNNSTPYFEVYAADNDPNLQYRYALYPGSYSDWTDVNDVQFAPQQEGSYTFKWQVKDTAGNTASSDDYSASYTWTIDTTAPSNLQISEPTISGTYGDATVDIDVSADGTPYEYLYRLLGVPGGDITPDWTTNSSFSAGGLPNGTYTFAFQARDAAGNIAMAVSRNVDINLTQDITPPGNLQIQVSPADPSPDLSSYFQVSSDDPNAQYRYALNP
ncbi:unnamed protein product, partial [marine sediment metagenome]